MPPQSIAANCRARMEVSQFFNGSGTGEEGHPNDSAAGGGTRQPPPQLCLCSDTGALCARPRACPSPRIEKEGAAAGSGSPWSRDWRTRSATVRGGLELEGRGSRAQR